MVEQKPSHESSSGRIAAKEPAGGLGGLGGRWDPRRSLAARLVLGVLPFVVVPGLVYLAISNALWKRAREDVGALLQRDALARERLALGQAAERRALVAEREAAEVLGVGRAAAAHVLASLTRGTERDAEVRLEESDAAPLAGHPAVSALYLLTASGTLRSVPPLDSARLARWRGTVTPFTEAATWTQVGDEEGSSRGRTYTVCVPVRDLAGKVVAEVGVDWEVGGISRRFPEARVHGEVEVILSPDGRVLLESPEGEETGGRVAASVLAALAPGERRVRYRGREALASVRAIPGAGLTYARLLPVSVVRNAVAAQVELLFETTRRARRAVQMATLASLILLAVPLVALARRSTAPVRALAAYADAIIRREDPGAPAGTERGDEVGRLARALSSLDRRIRRRLRSMEGLHDLARTGAVMTRPDETFARLSRRIAELVGARKAWFALWDAEEKTLAFNAPGFGIADQLLEGVRIPQDAHSLALLAYRNGETYVSNDIASDARASKAIAAQVDVRTNAVFAPLRSEAGTLGVLIVCDKPEPFDAEDEAAIQIYAGEAALLLRNARLYEELQQSFERLRDAHRNRDYFLQNINHELRTPLTAILGWSEVLAEDRPDATTLATAVEQIRRSAQFLLTLISDLLDLSRFEEGRTQIERSTTDLGTLVREAVDPVAVMAEAKGIAICVDAPGPGEATARIDPLRTRQVLWNLVHNAVKFTRRGGRIEVVGARDATGVTFTVADDGVGIDPKDLPFIFERFRQGDGSTTRAYRGTGIGLALAKAYAELHGGTIEAENRSQRGALFRVFLPDPLSDSPGSLPRPRLRL